MNDASEASTTVRPHESVTTHKTRANSVWQKRRHLLDTKSLSVPEIAEVLEAARHFRLIMSKDRTPLSLLNDRTVATVFYENSTRTRTSFDLAAKRLGATVVNLDVATSSSGKGETIVDTAHVLHAMDVDLVIQRHYSSGSAELLARALNDELHVVNAGDGWNEHPTQALLDALTMTDVRANLSGAKVAIIGDLLHSRVAHSNMWLLQKLGAKVHVVGPPSLMPEGLSQFGISTHTTLEAAIEKADFIIVLRMQLERHEQGLSLNVNDYKRMYRIDHARVLKLCPSVKVLDPGPVARDIGITNSLVNDPKYSLIEKQVNNGVYLRMAVLNLLLSKAGGTK